MNTKTIRPLAAAIGASFLAMSVVPTASAEVNPFETTQLSAGYGLASADKSATEGKCGEGKCGGSKTGSGDKSQSAEGKCGEGKCGGSKAESGSKSQNAEGKCGEGKCGGSKAGSAG